MDVQQQDPSLVKSQTGQLCKPPGAVLHFLDSAVRDECSVIPLFESLMNKAVYLEEVSLCEQALASWGCTAWSPGSALGMSFHTALLCCLASLLTPLLAGAEQRLASTLGKLYPLSGQFLQIPAPRTRSLETASWVQAGNTLLACAPTPAPSPVPACPPCWCTLVTEPSHTHTM